MLTLPVIRVRSDRDLAFVYVGKRKVYLGRPGSPEAAAKYEELVRELKEGTKSVTGTHDHKTLRPTLAQKTADPFQKGCGDSMREVQQGVTVDFLFQQYLEVQGPHINQSDRCRVKNIWKCIQDWFPGILCEDFDSVTLDDFRDRWKAKGNPKKGDGTYLYHYIEKVKSALLRVFRWGGKKKLVPGENIYDMEQLGEASRAGGVFRKKKKRMMTDEEFEAILSFLSPLWQDFFRLQYRGGMRTGETTGLNWEEINPDPDPESDLLLFEPEDHKNAWRGEERHIGLDAEAQAILAKYKGKRGYIFTPRDMRAEELGIDPKSDDPRLGRCKNKRLRTEKADRVFGAAVDKALEAGLISRRFAPYDLRKKAGTEAGLKYGVKGIQHKLGHKNINTQVAYDLGALDMLRKMGSNKTKKKKEKEKESEEEN